MCLFCCNATLFTSLQPYLIRGFYVPANALFVGLRPQRQNTCRQCALYNIYNRFTTNKYIWYIYPIKADVELSIEELDRLCSTLGDELFREEYCEDEMWEG